MRNGRRFIYSQLKIAFSLLVVLTTNTLGSQADALTYYLSPTGSNSNAGTSSSSPWKTFASAIPKLRAGDTLVLQNGTYNGSNSGSLEIDCSANAANGTASQPITIIAQNERQASLVSDGSNNLNFSISNCSYWTLQGLQISSLQKDTAPAGCALLVLNGNSNVTVRRNLFHDTNVAGYDARVCDSSSAISMWVVNSNLLIEENEFYDFHRHGIGSFAQNSEFRRNYFNARSHSRAGTAISNYPGAGNLFENNIAEGNCMGISESNGSGEIVNTNNKWLGNIALNAAGFYTDSRGNDLQHMIQNHTFQDNVIFVCNQAQANNANGIQALSSKNVQFKNNTVVGPWNGMYVAKGSSGGGDGTWTFFASNNIIMNAQSAGGWIDNSAGNISTFSFSDIRVSGNKTDFIPSSPNIKYTSGDPGLNQCKVFIPATSSVKGAGSGGTDIGANVLYRYENGLLTNKPLWDPATGSFLSGAIVAGVNDIAGSSLFDVHKRLNVNTNGCPFPPGYASGGAVVSSSSSSQTTSSVPAVTKPSSPINLNVSQQK